MTLKAMLENLDGLSEELKKEYKEKDGKFILDVDSVDGLVLENVTGLKTTLETLRTNERKLQQDLKNSVEATKQYQKKFEGIDPEAAKTALSKMDEIANWNGDKKIQEAIEANERKAQAKITELIKQHTEKVELLENDLTDSQSQLQDAIVTSRIIEAISKEGGNVDLLIPHVRAHVNMVKNNNGRWQPEVISDTGDPRIGDSQGNPMTIQQYVVEMKGKKNFAAAFPGANATGTGKTGSEEGSHQQTGSPTVIKASDKAAMSKNLADIAKGKVQVNMEE